MSFLFAGNGRAGLECLEILVNSSEEVSGVLTSRKKSPNIVEFAKKKGLLLPKSLEDVDETTYDNIFSVFYHRLIPDYLLRTADNKINFHGGRLPNYRGRFSNVWEIYNGESTSAVTAHTMEAEYDKGLIVDELSFPISDTETGKSLYDKKTEAVVTLFRHVLDDIHDDCLTYHAPVGENRFYDSLPNKGIIDDSLTMEQQRRLVRALHFPPHSPAIRIINGKRIEIPYRG